MVCFSDHEEGKVGVCWKITLVLSEILLSAIIAIYSGGLFSLLQETVKYIYRVRYNLT